MMRVTIFAIAMFAVAGRVASEPRCLTCHGMPNLAVRGTSSAAAHSFSVSPQKFAASVHGRLACRDCHGEVGPYPHDVSAGRPKVTCDQDCHAQDRSGKPYTHAAVAAEFSTSVHGARPAGRNGDKPSCLTCHGSGDVHDIGPAKHQAARARMGLCLECHADRERMIRNDVDPDAVASYKRSFHFKAIQYGARDAAVCEDCHSAHRILPSSDPASTVSLAALPSTCGRDACHPGARSNFAVSGANHLNLRVKREPILQAEEWLFWILTAGTMAMLVAGILLDVQRKLGVAAALTRGGRAGLRHAAALASGARRSLRTMRSLIGEAR